ncbi:ferritin-like domain-containing protein [Sporosarcina cyprini]|uniref:ferritin-like domain-containing protein n=1 Tax=Sporosarcina cyprini TaxID=2910523 RepID=UPI001EDE442C|nr:ferritin-like domain-containing protein [Sporosarcina cyprini]
MQQMDYYQGYDYAQQQAYQRSLQLMAEAVQGEREDQLFYDYLISKAPNAEQKDIITSIRNDEIRHNQLYRQMYQQLTGQEVPMAPEEEFVPPASYIDGIKKALFGELKAMEKYRIIRAGLPYREYRDVVFEILTDELKHATLYNFLFTENRTSSPAPAQQPQTPDEWVMYTNYLVQEGLEDVRRGVPATHILQEFILMGVLVGQGYTPEVAYQTVEEWERTGQSKLLQQSKNRMN